MDFQFARKESKADLLVSTNLDYTFVGDIQWVSDTTH